MTHADQGEQRLRTSKQIDISTPSMPCCTVQTRKKGVGLCRFHLSGHQNKDAGSVGDLLNSIGELKNFDIPPKSPPACARVHAERYVRSAPRFDDVSKTWIPSQARWNRTR